MWQTTDRRQRDHATKKCVAIDEIACARAIPTRAVATGVYLDIYPQNQCALIFTWLFCLLDPGQIRYRAIYTHPNQIPVYASDSDQKD